MTFCLAAKTCANLMSFIQPDWLPGMSLFPSFLNFEWNSSGFRNEKAVLVKAVLQLRVFRVEWKPELTYGYATFCCKILLDSSNREVSDFP